MNSSRTILLLSLSAILSGCNISYESPPPVADYYLNPDKDLSAIGRIVLVGLNNTSNYPQVSTDVTNLLFQALQKKQLFGLSVMQQEHPNWRSLQINPDAAFTLPQLAAMRKILRCDAVLTGTITEYQPYPHMLIGLRLKLVDLSDGQLLWAIEQVWDTADKTTESRIKKYFHSQMRLGYAPLQEQLVVVSSLKFIKFVVYETAETLQPDSQYSKPILLGLEMN